MADTDKTCGVCVDCEVPPEFHCAEGKRKEGDNEQ